MKTLNLILITVFTLLIVSCSNQYQDFIDKLKLDRSKNDLGVDLKYKVIKFDMLDTLYNHEHADSLQLILTSNIENIKQLDMSKNVFIKFKDQELDLRDDKNYYKNVVYIESNSSEWLTEIREILKKTDTLLAGFDNADILDKFELYSWYNRRYWQYNMNSDYEKKFDDLYKSAIKLQDLAREISTLKANPMNIIHYKAEVNFEQVNPLLGGAKQNLTEIVYFDENKNLIKE